MPRSTNVEHYARIVKEKSALRALILASQRISARAYEAEDDPNIILDEAEQAIFAIAENRARAGFLSMHEIVAESMPKIELLFEQKKLITGVPTGFSDLDRMTRGFQAGDLIIIAARPSMGKTSLVMNIAEHASLKEGTTVGFFSLEMSREQLFIRLLTSVARIDAHRLMSGAIGPREYQGAVAGDRRPRRGAAVHRRHARRGRARDAREGAAPGGGARPRAARSSTTCS